jgi:hypothetical protein
MITDKFIHIHIPKTAGQAIRALIRRNNRKIEIYNNATHLTLAESRAWLAGFNSEIVDSVPSFCFVRNPWDYYVSYFFYRQKMLGEGTIKVHIPLDHTGGDVKGFRKHMKMRDEIIKSGGKVLDTDGNWSASGTKRAYKFTTFSAWSYTMMGSGVDHIGRVESFAEDLGNILSTLAPSVFTKQAVVKAASFKVNASKHDHYRKYYDDATKELVLDWDERYIEEFGYEF